MPDFAALRRAMVDGQVRTNDVTDLRLLSAMLDLPRERFVSSDKAALAYLDRDLALGAAGRRSRSLLKPMLLAKLVQAAEISDTDRVLDIGCGSGYSSALLARLANRVVALESDTALAQAARSTLPAIGATNVTVVSGPLPTGWPGEAPYDAIVIEGATEVVPEGLRTQLKEGGRLVCVLGSGPAAKAMIYLSMAGEFVGRPVFDATAALLPGFERTPEFVF